MAGLALQRSRKLTKDSWLSASFPKLARLGEQLAPVSWRRHFLSSARGNSSRCRAGANSSTQGGKQPLGKK